MVAKTQYQIRVYIILLFLFFFRVFFSWNSVQRKYLDTIKKKKISSEKRENLYLFLFLETQKGFKYSQDITGDRIIIFNPCFAKSTTRELKCGLQRSSNRPAVSYSTNESALFILKILAIRFDKLVKMQSSQSP